MRCWGQCWGAQTGAPIPLPRYPRQPPLYRPPAGQSQERPVKRTVGTNVLSAGRHHRDIILPCCPLGHEGARDVCVPLSGPGMMVLHVVLRALVSPNEPIVLRHSPLSCLLPRS